MTNEEVVQRFFERRSGKSLNMRTDGIRLFSYHTCMAEWCNGTLYINTTKYSVTTSKQMCSFWYRAEDYPRVLVSGASRGVPSIFSFYYMYSKTEVRKRKMQAKFNKFIKDVDYFLNFEAGALSDASKQMIEGLIDSSKCNNYHKQRDKFLLIKTNLERRRCNDFKKKMGMRHQKDRVCVKSFSFAV